MPISGVQQQSSGFFHDLFAPLPEAADPIVSPKNGFDHIANYASTVSGAWDLFRVVDHVTQYLQNLPNLSDAFKDSVSKVSKVANIGGIGLSIPTIFSDLNTFRKKVTELIAAQNLPLDNPLRRQRVLQAGRDTFLSTVWLTNTVSQAVLFLNESGLVKLAQFAPIADGIYQGSSLIADGCELVQEIFKLHAYQNEPPGNAREVSAIEEKKWLSWMVIIKDVASIASAIIAAVGIALSVALSVSIFSMPVIAAIGLGLSSVWLTMKLSSYFYGEMIKERQATPILATV